MRTMTSVASPPPASSPGPEGLRLLPFRALRFATSDPAPLLSPPYDVIDEDERRELEASDPHNVVRLILPRDLDGQPGSAYAAAASLLAAWRSSSVLVPDPTPALYVYEMEEGESRTRGLVGAVGLTPPEAGVVLPHENTMAGPVADRLALTEATQANLEPIYLVYSGGGPAAQAVAAVDGDDMPLASAVVDGVTHRIWALTDPAVLHEIAADLLPRRAVIADGHHRYATYLRHQADRHAAGAGAGPWDRGLALLVDASTYGPQVHAIHRFVPGLSLDDAVSRAAAGFSVQDVPASSALAALAAADKAAAFVVTDGDRWMLLTDPSPDLVASTLPAERSAAWRALDVTIAHRVLIDRLWQLQDTEDVVGFEHDVPAAVAAAQRTGGVALLLNPTPVEAVAAVAEAGERMPRKSTLFTPKPRTGLLIRAYEDEPDRSS
jgi:uncharacterized protein (DUF1015 family)